MCGPQREPSGRAAVRRDRSPTLEAADGTRLVPAALFADGGHLFLQESEDAAVLCRMGERLRLAADGTQALWQDGELWIDGVRAAERFGLLTGETEDGVLYFARPQNTDLPTPNVNVPILMYHAVGDETWGYSDLFVRPSELENHLQYLADNGYETIFFDDLSHLEDYEKPVILTFDDGYDDNYTELYPLLQKYQAKATIFVIPRDLGKAHKMTAEQIQELAQSGLVSIQSHTWSHGNLSCMDEATLISEMDAQPRRHHRPDRRSSVRGLLSGGEIQRPFHRGRAAVLSIRPADERLHVEHLGRPVLCDENVHPARTVEHPMERGKGRDKRSLALMEHFLLNFV